MSAAPPARATRAWKGKARQQVSRQEDSGGTSGVVLPLQLLTSSSYQSVYTLPVLIGSSLQNLSLQVDTGSSDLWIASKSCSTSSCSQTGGHLYDPSSSTPTNKSLSMVYAEGEVSGPIVWDSVELGGYNVSNQALAAASSVSDEPLAYDFSGILGLALPLDSQIAQIVPPVYSNSPDGAAFASNLFSMTPSDTAPSAPFISLALERPGSDAVPSILGIGRHPAELIPDPSKIQYADLMTARVGALFWEASVRAVTVYVDGTAKPIALPPTGYSSAVLDSGTPVILASASIANGIYGALGISPAADGSYYVSCTTPINMTITLDNRPEIALHPLDLTYPPNSDSTMCIGLIQNADAVVGSGMNLPDLVLGVPFMRNVYTVMAYEPPENGGTFPANDTVATASYQVHPQLGLLGLTNITAALEEFDTVRVMNQPLGQTPQAKTSSSPPSKHLSVGIDVLLGCIGFFFLCAGIFVARWLYYRRKWRNNSPLLDENDLKDGSYALPDVAYVLSRHVSATDRYSSSEDTLRASRYADYRNGRDVSSHYTDDTAFTRVEDEGQVDEFGLAKNEGRDDFPDRATVTSWDSFFKGRSRFSKALPDSPPPSPGLMVSSPQSPVHRRMSSDDVGVASPLLVHTRHQSNFARSEDVVESGRSFATRAEAEPERLRSFPGMDSMSGGIGGAGREPGSGDAVGIVRRNSGRSRPSRLASNTRRRPERTPGGGGQGSISSSLRSHGSDS